MYDHKSDKLRKRILDGFDYGLFRNILNCSLVHINIHRDMTLSNTQDRHFLQK